MMYEVVKNTTQKKEFLKTWDFFCSKYDWENEPDGGKGIQYNLLLPAAESKKVIGTVELIPISLSKLKRNLGESNGYMLSQFDEIKVNNNRIWEIDKVCILEEFQRQGHFKVILQILYDHALKYKPKYYVGHIEKKFYRMLRIFLGIRIERKGEEFISPNSTLIPIIIDVEKIMNDKKKLVQLLNHTIVEVDSKNRKSSLGNVANKFFRKFILKDAFRK